MDEAFTLLRDLSRNNNVGLAEVAASIVAQQGRNR